MARIIANGVGNGKGRTGSNYYRHVRGRTIMAQLPGPNDDRKAKAKTNPNCVFLAFMAEYMKVHASEIEVGFEKTKYGSARNGFFQRNQAAFREAWNLPIQNKIAGCEVPFSKLENDIVGYATTNPTAIVIVDKAGYQTQYLTGAWPERIPLVPYESIPVLAEINVADEPLTITCGSPVRLYGARMSGVRYKVEVSSTLNGAMEVLTRYVYADSVNYLDLTMQSLQLPLGSVNVVEKIWVGSVLLYKWQSAT